MSPVRLAVPLPGPFVWTRGARRGGGGGGCLGLLLAVVAVSLLWQARWILLCLAVGLLVLVAARRVIGRRRVPETPERPETPEAPDGPM